MSYDDLLAMWTYRNLPGTVIDITPSFEKGCKRGDEIDAWLNDNNDECQYVIIDDLERSNFNKQQISHLLLVDPFYGLDEKTANNAITILNHV